MTIFIILKGGNCSITTVVTVLKIPILPWSVKSGPILLHDRLLELSFCAL